MWSIEQCEDVHWPIYHAAAMMDAISWLESLQRVEGYDAVQEDGSRRWRFSSRIAGRYFGLIEVESGDLFFAGIHPEWMRKAKEEEKELEEWLSSLPLSWLAIIPWKVKWISSGNPLYPSFLSLRSGEFSLDSRRIEDFTLEIPVANLVMRRMKEQSISDIRAGVGNARQILLSGFHFQEDNK